MESIEQRIQKQRGWFQTGATLSPDARLSAIRRLKEGILTMEAEIGQALKTDLGKSAVESYMSETGMVLAEISYLERHLKRWCRPKRRPTPLAQFPARSYELPCPYGTVLVMSPWNYPFLLSLEPAVDAIAAGNTVILKPSAYSPATSEVIRRLCETYASPEVLTVVTGGRDVNTDLLEQHYDYIFFTGGKTVGRLVMEKASRHLTPVTLELGGKSPCIVDETADLPLAARRIVFGKYLNLGQTCVAPDYLLVQETVKDRLLPLLREEIEKQFGADPLANENYGKIVNEKHFHRLSDMLAASPIYHGGRRAEETLRIEPTILFPAGTDSPSMQEEIFGPLLPVLTWRTWEEAKAIIERHPTPLALYVFSRNSAFCERATREISYGGGCINDTIIHLATSAMPFGGVGESGMGSYHGKRGFDTFTHTKSLVDKKLWLDLPMRYQPYTAQKETLIRMFLK
jgi:acyl-CoA reductase-like NAD-dependent aldehyde dehydrogenase